jgi:diguanylate cyclase (GGDEF)-like protein
MLNARQIVSLIAPAIFLLFSMSFLIAWLIDRGRRHILLFSLALLLYGVAAVSQIMDIPSDTGLNAMVSAAIYVISSSLLVEGILRRIGRHYHILIHGLFFAAIVGAIYYYYYIDRSLVTRIYVLNFGIGALFVATATRMLELRFGRLPDRIFFWIFLVFSIQFFGRTLLTIGADPIIAKGGKAAAAAFGETLFWISLQVSLSVFGAALALALLATAISDVIEDLKSQRDSDPLTRLLNRRGFDTKAAEILADPKNDPVSAIMFDIDHFKSINDTFGHRIGDEILQAVGDIVSRTLKAGYIAGRMGGEEFVVVMQNSDCYDAFGFAERLRTTLANKNFHSLSGRKVTASFGIAVRRQGETSSMLFARADDLLYAAKSQGRNRSCLDQPLKLSDPLARDQPATYPGANSGQVIFLEKHQPRIRSEES